MVNALTEPPVIRWDCFWVSLFSRWLLVMIILISHPMVGYKEQSCTKYKRTRQLNNTGVPGLL